MPHPCHMCKKKFITPSKLKVHLNRKTPCVKQSILLECNFCKVKFKCNTEKIRHNKTDKHIKNSDNKDNTESRGNNYINNYITNNIINIICPVNVFANTSIEHLDADRIGYLLGYKKDIIERLEYNNEENTTNPYYSLYFMKAILNIFKDLNFSLEKPSNNNCKIIFFSNGTNGSDFNKMMCYLILKINTDGKLIWQQINYYTFLDLIFELMHTIENKFNNEKLTTALEYLDKYFVNNIKMKDMCKVGIEMELDNISDTVNTNNLDTGIDYTESIKKLTKLWNGEQPEVQF